MKFPSYQGSYLIYFTNFTNPCQYWSYRLDKGFREHYNNLRDTVGRVGVLSRLPRGVAAAAAGPLWTREEQG